MKFIDQLSKQYELHGLSKPQWLNEYNEPVVASAQQAAVPAAGTNTPGSVVTALMQAIQTSGLGKDPDVQKVKNTVTQKVADAKKQIVDQATKTVDTITKAVQILNQPVPGTGSTPSTVPTGAVVK